MTESPDTVHGRLLESVHLSGYTFERACGELEWLLDHNRWQRVGRGYKDINAFLATIDFSEFKVALDQRKKLAARLAKLGAGQRATGRLMGVSKETIARDLEKRDGTNVPVRASLPGPDGTNVPSWFQADVDPSREAKRLVRQAGKPDRRADRLAAAVWPDGKYGVILADPPWRPEDGLLDPTRRIENQYPTMTLAELLAERPKIDELAAADCVLLLWTTTQKLAEAITLIDGWGFTVKSGAVWVKGSIGMGYWFRARHELLVLATRGTPMTPLEADRPDSVIEAARRGHSEKPDEVYVLVEQMFPRIPKVELYARAERPGWSRGTNEAVLRLA